ncbi:Berardinelli-Seip congenital lipodystrophy 2 (seipin) [Sparganum proliferum]
MSSWKSKLGRTKHVYLASGNTDAGVKSNKSTGWSGEIVHAYNLLTRLFCLQFVFLVISFLVFLLACHLFIPNTHFEHEVRLRHERPLKHHQLFAKADLDLSLKGASAFTAGQAYRVDFHLVVPESPSNRDAGMSLVDLIFFSENGTATARLSNSFLPDHQPSIIDLMDTLMFSPLYLFRVWRKEQKLVIRLHEAFVDNWDLPSMRAEVHLTADHLHWYSSRLVVHAVFNPLTKILNSHTWVFCLVFMLMEMLLFNLLLFCFLVVRYHKTVFVACVAFLSKLVPGGTGPGAHSVSVSTQTTDGEKETEKEDQEHDELPESVGEPPAALTLSTTAETQRAEDDDSPILILGTDSSSDSF